MVACIYQSPFYNASGYAAEARGLVRGLVEVGVTVRIDHIGKRAPEALAPAEYQWFRRLEETPVNPAEAVFVGASSPIGIHRPPSPWAVLRTMYDTDRIEPDWVRACEAFDEIWVPSALSRDVFVSSGLPKGKVRVVHGGVDTSLFRPDAPPLQLARRKAFAFLSVFDWQWRKGWDVLVSAYCREFRPDEPVTLYLKASRPSQQPEIISELFYFIRQVLGMRVSDTPDIVLVDPPMTDTQMAGLYTAADAFVLPSRGEGYCRPYLEAMACGRPVIGTAWGGQTDFLDEAVGYLIPIEGLEPVPDFDPCHWYRGHRWAAPTVTDLRRLMRHVYENREEARRKGVAGRRRVEAAWDHRQAGAAMAREMARLVREKAGRSWAQMGFEPTA